MATRPWAALSTALTREATANVHAGSEAPQGIAAETQWLTGRDYLEKILQVTHDIRAVPERKLTERLGQEIEAALADLPDTGPFNGTAWLRRRLAANELRHTGNCVSNEPMFRGINEPLRNELRPSWP